MPCVAQLNASIRLSTSGPTSSSARPAPSLPTPKSTVGRPNALKFTRRRIALEAASPCFPPTSLCAAAVADCVGKHPWPAGGAARSRRVGECAVLPSTAEHERGQSTLIQPERLAQLNLRSLEDALLRLREVLARAIDVKDEHRES